MNWIITDFEEGARLTFKEPNDGSIHWNDAQKESVKQALRDTYLPSSTAQLLLDQAVHINLLISESGSSGQYIENEKMTPTIMVDFTEIQSLYYIGKDGLFKNMSLERVLIHELYHTIENRHDLVNPETGETYVRNQPRNYNHLSFDHLGEVVRKTNQVMLEAGLESEGGGRVMMQHSVCVQPSIPLLN